MKKSYIAPDLELFSVRPDEQIAASCVWIDNGYDPGAPAGASGYDCFYGYSSDKVYGISGS